MQDLRFSWIAMTLALLVHGCPCDPEEITDDDSANGDDDIADDDTADDDSANGDDDTADDDADDDTADDDTADDPYIQPAVYVTPLDLEPGGTATVHYYGTLAQEDDLTIHYGFNGWNEVEGVSDMVVVEDHGNTTAYRQVEMTPVLDGFETTVDLPTDGRAMHFTFFTDDDGTEVWDNNDDLDYNQSIVFPYIGPILTWNDSVTPSSGVVIGYETSVPCLGTLEYGNTAALGTTVVGDDLSPMHHFTVTGLPADSDIYYRVHDSAGHTSDVYSFRTAPANPQDITFAALGDMQDTGEHSAWAGTVAELQARPAVDFLVSPGDLTSGDGPGSWWTFFDRARDLFPSVVLMPSPGNHDTPGSAHNDDTSSFERYFDLPLASGNGPVYRFDYGAAAFLSLNSEAMVEFAIGETQWVWAESQAAAIAAAGDRDWVFAYCHVPPYNAGVRHAEAQGNARVLTQLFDGLVDWVFSGHEHLYQRTHPLRFNAQIMAPGAYGNAPSEGVGYIVVPPAGQSPAHEIFHVDSPDADRRDRLAFPQLVGDEFMMDSENGFVLVYIDGTSIDIETWWIGTADAPLAAHLVDVVTYSK